VSKSGEPTPIQHIKARAIHPRTFHIDPSGRVLVAQHNLPTDVRDAVPTIPADLSVFRIGDDAKLTVVRKDDIDEPHERRPSWPPARSCTTRVRSLLVEHRAASGHRRFAVVTTVSQMAQESTRPI
jgi:hypothetical protein